MSNIHENTSKVTSGKGNTAVGEACLKNTYSKLVAKQPINVVFVGGSVTDGAGSTAPAIKGWPRIVLDNLRTRYSATINEYRQSIGGTGSLLSVFRFDFDNNDIIPDLLFIEYAVNDYYNGRTYEQVVRSSEAIVRKAYAKNPYVDIVYVLTFDRNLKDSDYAQLCAHRAVAEHYGLLTIKLADGFYGKVTVEMESNYFTDGVHPNDSGYAIYAEIITNKILSDLYKCAQSAVSYSIKELPNALSDHMATARIINADKIDIRGSGGWQYVNGDLSYLGKRYGGYVTSSSSGSVLTFTSEGTDIGILYAAGNDKGKFSLSVDGKVPVIIDAYLSYSNPKEYVISGLDAGKHTLTIKILDQKHAQSSGNVCQIGALLIN